MIIYGRSGAKNVQTKSIPNASCPSCESNSLEASIYSSYAHLYWIPLFSLGKKSFVQCCNCGKEFSKKERPEQAAHKILELKSDYRIPISHFAGVFLFALMIMGFNYSDRQDRKEDQALLLSPVTGDIYELKIDAKEYTTFKVLDNEEDSVAIIYNIYATNKAAGLPEINKAENYTDDIYVIGKNELAEMFEDGTILDIERE